MTFRPRSRAVPRRLRSSPPIPPCLPATTPSRSDLMERFFGEFWPQLGLGRDEFWNLGRFDYPWGPQFSMTVLALRTRPRQRRQQAARRRSRARCGSSL